MTIRLILLICCVTYVIAKPNLAIYSRTDSANQRKPVNVGPNNSANSVAALDSSVANSGQIIKTNPRNSQGLRSGPNNSANAVAAVDSSVRNVGQSIAV